MTQLGPDTPWLIDPNVRAVFRAVQAGGQRLYFVGGCVRNALLGAPVSDVDLATDARPERVMELTRAAGLKAVPTGIDHGTVTVVVQGQGFEVTTFRKDVHTDGRRARVTFAADITDDARRRDFTLNALYADLDGNVLDPLGGLPDLLAGRIRFIEDAAARIREDYLRILRFFRFHAHYGDPVQGFDPDTLDAISRNLDGLSGLSAERITAEMLGLLGAADPAPAVAAMRMTGVLPAVLPGGDDRLLPLVVAGGAAVDQAPDALLRLFALCPAAPGLRLSKADARYLKMLGEVAVQGPPLPEIAYRHGLRLAVAALVLRAALGAQPPDAAALPALCRAADAKFPLRGRDLPHLHGPALGRALQHLEQHWIDANFDLDRDALLKRAKTA